MKEAKDVILPCGHTAAEAIVDEATTESRIKNLTTIEVPDGHRRGLNICSCGIPLEWMVVNEG